MLVLCNNKTMKNSKIATQYFKQGYNCAQSVFITYCEKFGIQKEVGLKLSSSFGGGMGRLREVCGAVSSMFAILGLEKGYTDFNDDKIKEKHYALIQKAANKFKEKHKTIICRELLGLENENISPIPTKRTEEYYLSRPCENFIETACEIIDEFLTHSK